jgi:hypothetical protein
VAATPDAVTSIVRLLRPPPVPTVPEPLQGKPLITIDAAFLGDRAKPILTGAAAELGVDRVADDAGHRKLRGRASASRRRRCSLLMRICSRSEYMRIRTSF